MNDFIDKRYPTVKDLRAKAKKRIPKFAFDYLEGGCMDELGLRRNLEGIEAVQVAQPAAQALSGLRYER